MDDPNKDRAGPNKDRAGPNKDRAGRTLGQSYERGRRPQISAGSDIAPKRKCTPKPAAAETEVNPGRPMGFSLHMASILEAVKLG
jgi:hypothetical protein